MASSPADVRPASVQIVLPGGRFGVGRIRDLPRLTAGAATLLGPRARSVARSHHPRKAERRWAKAALGWLDASVEVTGLEHIDRERAYVVAPLHEGFVDALALIHCLPLNLRFVARDELTGWPLLGRAIHNGGHPTITPEAGAPAYRSMLRSASTILANGESLVVFPQGAILGIEAAFNAGPFRLAAALNRPMLPVVLTGSHRIWDYPFNPQVSFGESTYLRVLPAVEPREAIDAMRPLERAMKRAALAAPVPPRRFVPERDGFWDDYAYAIDPDFRRLADRVALHRRLRTPSVPAA